MRGKRVSDDLAWTIVRLSLKMDIEDISSMTRLSTHHIKKLLRHWRKNGSPVSPLQSKKLRGRRRKLSYEHLEYIREYVRRHSDVYLDELQQGIKNVCGVKTSISTVWRSLRRCGFTLKKTTREAIERSVEKRAEFTYRIGRLYRPEQLVFVDESACDRRTTYRGRAWAISGQRATRKAFFVRGRRYSILPAMSMDGILSVSIVEGAFDGMRFARFIDGLLHQMSPFPGPNSVIVMDNCAIHKHPLVLELIEERGMRCEFLPPYSPDYNPIELGFSSLKSHLRRHGELVRAATENRDDLSVYLRLHEAVWSISAQDAKSWFHHCGYL